MQQIGYSLIDAGGNEVAHWGDTLGQCAGLPNRIDRPDGQFTHGTKTGEMVGDWKLVERWAVSGSDRSIVFNGQQIVVTIPVTEAMVVAERERRLAAGFSYDFKDARGVHVIGTTPQDMIGWNAVTTLAQAAINLGQTGTPINIVTNTAPVAVTAMEWQQVLGAAGQFQQPIWAASFRLQGTSPIPADYTSDRYWQ